MRVRHIVAGVAICAAATGVATGVHAWGNGCIDGIQFPTEQAYYAYLQTHPNAAVGVCTTTTTTTPRSTTSLPPTSAPTTPTSTVASSTSTTVTPSSAPPVPSSPGTSVVVPSTPSSTPSTSTPTTPLTEQPGEMCNTSSQNSDGATSTGCALTSPPPSGGTSGPTGHPSAALPATGPSETKQTAMAAVGLVAMGAALFSIARRKDRTS